MRHGPQKSKKFKASMKLVIPAKCRGAIIGMRGETIKGLEGEHGTTIKLQDQAELKASENPAESYLMIHGNSEDDVKSTSASILKVVVFEQERQQLNHNARRRRDRRAQATSDSRSKPKPRPKPKAKATPTVTNTRPSKPIPVQTTPTRGKAILLCVSVCLCGCVVCTFVCLLVCLSCSV